MRRLLLAAVSLVLSLVAAEAGLRATGRIRTLYAINELAYQPSRNRYDMHRALLHRLHGNRLGVPLAVVFLPGRADADEDRERRRFLKSWCQTESVPFLDLTHVIHEAGQQAFIPGNPHWNERGHMIAGTAVPARLGAGALT